MNPTLLEILNRCKSTVPNKHEFVLFTGSSGAGKTWFIDTNKVGVFWNDVCSLVATKEADDVLMLAERCVHDMPVTLRCSLSFSDDIDEPYDDAFIKEMIYCLQTVVKEHLEVASPLDVVCCLLEAEPDYSEETGNLICSFTLRFPFCRTEIANCKTIRNDFISLLRRRNVIARLKQQPLNDWETIVDNHKVFETMPIYRNVLSNHDREEYLTRICGDVTEDLFPGSGLAGGDRLSDSEGGPLDRYELDMGVFNLSSHSYVMQNLIDESMFDGRDADSLKPLFLSNSFQHKITLAKTGRNAKQRKSSRPEEGTGRSGRGDRRRGSEADDRDDDSSSEEEERGRESITFVEPRLFYLMVPDLLGLLKRHRYEKEHYWRDVGKAIYNTYTKAGRKEEGLSVWIEFSKQSDEFDETACREQYPTFGLENNLSVETIAFYAREDSPGRYKTWHDKILVPIYDRAINGGGTDSEMAEAFYSTYWLDYKCFDVTKKRWGHFYNHCWNKTDGGVALTKTMSSNFRDRFDLIKRDVVTAKCQSSSEDDKEKMANKDKKVSDILRKLKSHVFKGRLLKELAECFYDERFDRICDTDPNLMGLGNGILECCSTYACVRPGKPEDFVRKRSNILWQEFTEDSPSVVKCRKWIKQVFPVPELERRFYNLMSSCLLGGNVDKKFNVFTGTGNNSKSKIKKLLQAVFGEYCVDLPMAALSSKTKGSGPNPEIAQLLGARITMADEPDKDEVFRNGIIKLLTGGDSFFARGCNSDGGSITAMFKIFLLCNDVPAIPNADDATRNRWDITPFLSKWTDAAPEDEQTQMKERHFKADKFFDRQIPGLAPAFLWIIVTNYENYIKEGLAIPPIMKEYIDDYWEETDIYNQFIRDMIKTAYTEEGKRFARELELKQSEMLKEKNSIKKHRTVKIKLTPDEQEKYVNRNVYVSVDDMFAEFKVWFARDNQGQQAPNKSLFKKEMTSRLGYPMAKGWPGLAIRETGGGYNLAGG